MDLTIARSIVQATYNAVLFRDPDEPAWTLDAAALVDGSLTADALAQQLTRSPERAILVTLPTYATGAAIVATYQSLASRAPTVAELDTWASALQAGTRTLEDLRAALTVPPPPAGLDPPPAPPGPTAPLHVTAIDSATSVPIAGARVTLTPAAGDAVTTTTDARGAAVPLVPVGTSVTVVVSAPGYAPFQVDLPITDGSDHYVSAVLTPARRAVADVAVQTATPDVDVAAPAALPDPPAGSAIVVPVDDSQARPPAVVVAPVVYETRDGVRSISRVSLGGTTVPDFGDGPGGIIGIIVSGIAALFGGGSSGADIDKISQRVDRLGNFALQLAQTLATYTTRDTHDSTLDGNLFDKIIGGVLGPIINGLAALIRGGAGDLSKLLAPISDGLKKLLNTVRHIYQTWLKPILHVIDVTRQVLRVLAAFHLQFAAALDAQLGRLEGKLTAPILALQSKINELRNVVNNIVTLDGALQRVTLLQSMVKHAGCVQRAIDQAPMAPPGTYPDRLTVDDPSQLVPDVQAALEQYVDAGDGPWADYNADWLEALDQASVS
jgi:hypothetical protein